MFQEPPKRPVFRSRLVDHVLSQFCNLGAGMGMCSTRRLLALIVGSASMVAFQYEQILGLVNRLMLQYNVVCSLMKFELLLTGVPTLKTTLSTLY